MDLQQAQKFARRRERLEEDIYQEAWSRPLNPNSRLPINEYLALGSRILAMPGAFEGTTKSAVISFPAVDRNIRLFAQFTLGYSINDPGTGTPLSLDRIATEWSYQAGGGLVPFATEQITRREAEDGEDYNYSIRTLDQIGHSVEVAEAVLTAGLVR